MATFNLHVEQDMFWFIYDHVQSQVIQCVICINNMHLYDDAWHKKLVITI